MPLRQLAIEQAWWGWSFATAPADAFHLRWGAAEPGYVGGTEDAGEVPEDAVSLYVCALPPTVDTEYTVTLRHPDDPGDS